MRSLGNRRIGWCGTPRESGCDFQIHPSPAGNHWFLERERLGPIPVQGDHAAAERLYRTFADKFLKNGTNDYSSNSPMWTTLLDDFWTTFVLDNVWKSRIIAALPRKTENYGAMLERGLVEFKRSFMVRPLDDLEEHGVCADHMHMDVSSIPQAGHGAFASRPLRRDDVVLPVPLIHIPDREILEMYHLQEQHLGEDVDNPDGVDPAPDPAPDRTRLAGHQLLLNYCLGHGDSTVLLCPYGPVFNMINHNQTLANVRLQWASPKRSNHHPKVLREDPSDLNKYGYGSVLAMELVATRDIQRGEEILLDYGDDWERAWQSHVATWEPTEGAEDYVPAWQLNESPEPLRTVFEALEDPYPDNVVLTMNKAFLNERFRKKKSPLAESIMDDHEYVKCEILRRRDANANAKERDGEYFYAVAYSLDGDRLVEDVPRQAFKFDDLPSTTDIYISNAFRHDIRIPDDLFPETWKNARQDS
jgi:SET domain